MIEVGERKIGPEAPVFVIAEAGANHNQDFGLARKLIDVAVEAGADAVKFQIYSAETMFSKKVPAHSGYSKPLWDLIKEIETPRDWIPELAAYCVKKGILFFATPFDLAAVDDLDSHVELYKIASFELVDYPLLSYTAGKGKPVILSTGMATLGEIEEAVAAIEKSGNHDIVLLQCASRYPAEPAIMNLRAMETLRNAFPNTVVGLSDHTLGIHISVAAVAMGAKVIEKHFTLSRQMEGPDHPFAIEPDELKELVRQIREVEAAMGDGRKHGPSPEEMENYRIVRRSIHAKTDIPEGTRITPEMLIIKRPGLGIHPRFLDVLVGKRALRDIEADEWITWEMV